MIPKIIFQTWKTAEVPEHWKPSQSAIKTYFKDWTYVFHTDDDNREFIKTYYSWFLPTYDSYPYPIMRADVVRYFFLHHFGGVYMDLDIEPTCNFEHLWTDTRSDLYLVRTPNGNTFSNCFMASTPKHPFWVSVFHLLAERANLFVPTHHFTVIYKTGPLCIDAAVQQYDKTIGLLPHCLFSTSLTHPHIKNEKYVRTLKGQSWNRWDCHILQFIFIHRKLFIGLLCLMWIHYVYLCIG